MSAAAPKPVDAGEALARAKRYNEKLKRKIAELKQQQSREEEAKKRAADKARREAAREAARTGKPVAATETKEGKGEAKEAKVALPTRDEVKAAFLLFDTDKSGFIEWDEFQLLTAQLGHALGEKEVKAAIASFDKDKDGKVSLDEFYAWYTDPAAASSTSSTDTAAGAAVAALIQGKLLLYKTQEALKRLAAAKPLELKESKSGDIRHSAAFTVGSFGAPAAAITASIEFKHVVDEAFVTKSRAEGDPIVFVSFDIKMVAGKATAEEHKQFFERLLLPILELPELPREIRGLRIHVASAGRDTVRITLQIPNPKTARAFDERRRERTRYLTAVEERKTDPDVSLPSEPPASDDDLRQEVDPVEILASFGIDFSKLLKKAQVRVELAHNLETVQTVAPLNLGDVLKARVAVDTIIDPAIVKAVLDGLVTAMGDPGPKKLAKANNAFFGTAVKLLEFAVSVGDLTPLIALADQVEGGRGGSSDEPPPSTEALEADIKDRLERGQSLGSKNVAYLLKGDFRRLLKLFINAKASRRSYKFNDFSAMLMAAKIGATVVSKDIEEITAVHIRAKTGIGASLTLDRVLLFPAVADILSAVVLEPSREVRDNRASRY